YVYRSRIKKKVGLPQAKEQPAHLKPLTPRQREAVTRYGEGRTQREVAEVMGISEQAVNTLIYLARKRKQSEVAKEM
ncbi:sigma-70 region 4 domain-containing protein, partial [Sphingomonas sp. PsM26]|nr:sigma-70 region 4 domain-containing protein [Sphingomonas sp. PsM26]